MKRLWCAMLLCAVPATGFAADLNAFLLRKADGSFMSEAEVRQTVERMNAAEITCRELTREDDPGLWEAAHPEGIPPNVSGFIIAQSAFEQAMISCVAMVFKEP